MANTGFSYEDYIKWCEALKNQWNGKGGKINDKR